MISDDELYIVVDIETDGPAPGINSMLSIGAIATSKDKELGSFYRKVNPVEGATQSAFTMKWWKTQPDAWNEVITDTQPAYQVMKSFHEWITSFAKQPVFVAHPTGFDYAFVSWYYWKFLGKNPFSSPGGTGRLLDLQSYIAGRLNIPLSQAHRTNLPPTLQATLQTHNHKAIDDARGYADILRKVLNFR